jgi:hypothetical protein
MTTINTTFAECIKSTNGIFKTLYVNICTGEVKTVAVGAMDLIGCALLVAVGLAVAAMFAGMATDIWRSNRRY